MYTHPECLLSQRQVENNSQRFVLSGNVFDEKTTIDSETILSSRYDQISFNMNTIEKRPVLNNFVYRWPCTRSFADPVTAFKDPNNGGSNAEALK